MNGGRPSARGDEAELYRDLHRALERAVSARVTGPGATVEDACGFAWEQLVRCQPQRGERLFAWLVTVAVREGWRLVRLERRATPENPQRVEALAGAERGLGERARALETLAALTRLRPVERRLLALRAQGFTYREICAIEHRSYTWVDRHLKRGRARLHRTEGAED